VTAAAALAARGLTKRFGPVTVLDNVDLTLERGEIHGLLGENGSGKSTLIKILSGFHSPDGGSLEIGGRPEPLPLPLGRPVEVGLRFVHQDLGFMPNLTVAENFHLGLMARAATGWRVSDASMRVATASALAAFGVDLDPRVTVRKLSGVQRALLAVVRAVHDLPPDRGILVLDEPTVFLPHRDVAELFALVRRIAAGGGAVLLVSHDLDEIRDVTHTVSVLRDGRMVGSRPSAGASTDDLIDLIVGRKLEAARSGAVAGWGDGPGGQRRDDVLVVEGLVGPQLKRLDFRLARGEILGVAGLEGSGAETLPYLLYGAQRAAAGRVTIAGRPFDLTKATPGRALRAGMVLIPADRRRLGGLLRLPVEDNLVFPRLRQFRAGPMLRRRAIRRDTVSLIDRFDIRPPRPDHAFGNLSGGNQQKAVMAKWLAVEPEVLLLHEPTQGVDVGARRQIHRHLQEAAASGRAVLCVSSDFEQLATLCHRVMVFRHGRLAHNVTGDRVTKQFIAEACLADSISEGAT
jgi:ribose transport system ATP-binding protein